MSRGQMAVFSDAQNRGYTFKCNGELYVEGGGSEEDL